MSELQQIIENIRQSRDMAKKSFVYYNKTDGSIHKISNKSLDLDDYEKLIVDLDEAEPILLGKKKIKDFYVKYDISEKCLRLTEKTYEDALEGAIELCYEIPLQKTFSKHVTYKPVYEGIEVYLFKQDMYYEKGWFIWHDESVYRLEEDTYGRHPDEIKKTLIVSDVIIGLNWFAVDQGTFMSTAFKQIYEGIPHVDVWYEKLPYVEGQHVWYDYAVYRYKTDVPKNTPWSEDNVDLVVDNIKLYQDENHELDFDIVQIGHSLLSNNKLYVMTQKEINTSADSYWYGRTKICVSNSVLFDTVTGDYESFKCPYEFADLEDCVNGQLVLIGKTLHLTEVGKDFDLIITQNQITDNWEFELNPYTRRFLQSTDSNLSDVMHFSITEKDDPNILYNTLKVSMQDLIHNPVYVIPFKYNWEKKLKDVSVFTSKFFKNYKYERIESDD